MTPARHSDPNNQLAEVIDAEAPAHRIIRALSDALAADVVNRDGTRSPDHRARTAAALALLEYRVGRPVARSEVINIDASADSAVGLEERLRHSPALRQLFRKMLESAEGPAVDV